MTCIKYRQSVTNLVRASPFIKIWRTLHYSLFCNVLFVVVSYKWILELCKFVESQIQMGGIYSWSSCFINNHHVQINSTFGNKIYLQHILLYILTVTCQLFSNVLSRYKSKLYKNNGLYSINIWNILEVLITFVDYHVFILPKANQNWKNLCKTIQATRNFTRNYQKQARTAWLLCREWSLFASIKSFLTLSWLYFAINYYI